MKRLALLPLLFALCTSVSSQDLKTTLKGTSNNFYSILEKADKYFNDKFVDNSGNPAYNMKRFNADSGMVLYNKIDGEYAKFKRWEWYWRDRILDDGSFPDLAAIKTKVSAKQQAQRRRAGEPAWTCINQTTCTGGYNGMGRTKCVAFHPTDANTFYVGAPIGGVWKTTDGGHSYEAISDNLPYVAAGTVLVDYSNPSVLYISVSDNGGWWNYTLGIYKSTDGGATWNPTGLKYNFTDGVAIYETVMSPTNPLILFVAASNGLWRTENGGVNWSRVRSGAHNDVKFRPGDGETIYACSDDYWGSSEIYRSTNAGDSWGAITDFNIGKNGLKIAVTPANPDMLAVRHTVDKLFYVSKDQGNTFTQKTSVVEDAVLFISPSNESIIYCGYVNPYRSDDGGVTWNQIAMWYGGTQYPEVHADQQYIGYNPLNGLLYFCNDGGVYSYDEGLKHWEELSDGLVITQYYRIALAQNDPVYMIGGTQDNGGRKRNTNGTWSSTNGGDAMEVAVDPVNYNISYSTYCYGEIYRTTNNWGWFDLISDNIPGQPEGDWVTPYQLDPNDRATIVAGYDEIYISHDRGDSWIAISNLAMGNIQALEVAPSNSNIIYASRDNILARTDNGGGAWSKYTGPESNERITDIAVHQSDPMRVWISYAGYRGGSKTYYSNNGGASWTNISGNLPNVPVNVIIYENNSDNERIYAGTDAGVYFRDNTTNEWYLHGIGLPFTSVTDLEIQYTSQKLRAGTHGRGVWETNLRNVAVNEPPVVQITSPLSNTELSGELLTIEAIASDTDGEITHVEFFINGALILSDNQEPYSVAVPMIPSGDIVIIARAYDDNYGLTETPPVVVSVPCINELYINETIIGTNGSWNNQGDDKFKVFDGDVTSFFDATESADAWVGLDMGEARNVVSLSLYPRSGFVNRMNGGLIQLANQSDFSDARTIDTVDNIKQLDWYCFYIALEQNYRYIRYVSAPGGHCNVAEMEVRVSYPALPQMDGNGIHATYFSDNEMQKPVLNRIEQRVFSNEPISNILPGEQTPYSILWQGTLLPPVTASYTLFIVTNGDVELQIDGNTLISETGGSGIHEYATSLSLVAGENRQIEIAYVSTEATANVALYWKPEGYAKQAVTQSYLKAELNQSISLSPGWNLVSLYVHPEDDAIETLFSGIDIRELKSFDGFYNASIENFLNSLQTIQPGVGYLVYVNASVNYTLNVRGPVYDYSNDGLSQGWNLYSVGSYSIAVQNISGVLDVVKDFDGFWDETGTGGLEQLEPGKAYFVKIK